MMKFDVKTDQGVNSLNEYLADRSYISGYQPTQDDVSLFNSFAREPTRSTPHVHRWFKHIKSFRPEERTSFPAENGRVNFFGAASGGAAAAQGVSPRRAGGDTEELELFDSDADDSEEASRIRAQRLRAYAERRAPSARSCVILEVKPWDDETDMSELEAAVRGIDMDGLAWGTSKLIPVGYGIEKLQITCIVEDEKVSVDGLTETIVAFEELVQSVDIAAFNKI